MSQTQGNRKRRGRSRGRKGAGKSPDQQPQQQRPGEDARTFWERSNARLGVDPAAQATGNGARRGRVPVEFPCAVCGTMVHLDRWPKHRLDVRCEPCRALSSLLPEEEDDADLPPLAEGVLPPSARRPSQQLEGLPELTEEDLQALAELRGAGLVRSGGGGGGGGNNQPRNRRPGKPQVQGQGQAQPSGEGGSRRRRRRGGGGGPAAGQSGERPPREEGAEQSAGAPEGGEEGAASEGGGGDGRRRRRRRRGGERRPGGEAVQGTGDAPAPVSEG